MNRMPSSRAGALLGAFLVALGVAVGATLSIADPTALQLIRNASFDQFQRLRPRQYRDNPVRIIDIDEESLQRLGQWPWPRDKVAELIGRLRAADPAAIALDIVFAEPDRTSPQALVETWPLSPQARQLLGELPNHDRQLADAIGKGKVVLGFALNQGNRHSSVPANMARIVEIGASPAPYLPSYPRAIGALPLLSTAAAGNGALTLTADADGVCRKMPLMLNVDQSVVPAFIAEIVRIAEHDNNLLARTDVGGLIELRIGRYTIPTTASGEIWLHYSPPVAERAIPAWQILAGTVEDSALKQRILLIGTSAQGLMDQRFYPLGGVIAGIEVHAQALEQILDGTLLLRPSWASALELLAIVAGGLLIGAIALGGTALSGAAALATMLALLWLGAWLAFADYRLLIDATLPSLQLTGTFIIASLFRHLAAERRQRWIKLAFSRYISPNLVEYLLRHPEDLQLGGHQQTCSFVFTDLSDFTTLMEQMAPSEAIGVLNDYLENMITIAFEYHGTLDRIVGDAVAIMFSAPIPQPDHRSRALNCALAMRRFANDYSAKLQSRGIAFGKTRIGVHSGEVIVGNLGGKTIFDYRALGDAVNTASRLEGANKYLGTQICVSEATLSACPEIQARPIGRILLKGKSRPIMAFEPIAANDNTIGLAEYLAAYDLLRQADPTATEAFRRYLERYPEDRLAAFHYRRLSQQQSSEIVELHEH